MTHEGYSPGVIRLAVRQGGRVPFKAASEDLRDLAGVTISPSQVRRLTERVGGEWARARDQEATAFEAGELKPEVALAPQVAVVMLDGGKVQTRAEGKGRGVHDDTWRETKTACCLTLDSPEYATDPQPEPPAAYLDRKRVPRLAAELKRRGGRPSPAGAAPGAEGARRVRRRRSRRRSKVLVRTVLASTATSEAFGWQVSAEVHRRRLGEARRKACVCDGLNWNWSLFAVHLLPLGFVAILDIVHLISYLYGAANAAGGDAEAAWPLYEAWLRLAWAGQVTALLAALRREATRLGEPPAGAKDSDPRQVLATAVGYVENNRGRMDYAAYRKAGLPISSAPVESVIKQMNQRVKGTEKFWLPGEVEGVLQVRAAYLSQDDRAERYWARGRPRTRAARTGPPPRPKRQRAAPPPAKAGG